MADDPRVIPARPFYRRAWPYVVAAILLVAVVVLVLCVRPLPQTRALDLIPPQALAVASVRLDPGGPVAAQAMAVARGQIAGLSTPIFVKALLGGVAAKALPQRLTLCVLPGDSPTDPAFLVTTSLSGPLRLLPLAPGLLSRVLYRGEATVREGAGRLRATVSTGDSGYGGMRAHTTLGDSLVLSSSAAPLLEALGRYGSPQPAGGEWAQELSFLSQGPPDSVRLSMLNASGRLTDLFATLEAKFAFAAFPSIAWVQGVRISVDLGATESSGSAVFSSRTGAPMDEVDSDVRFLYGALRRALRAQDIQLKGTTTVSANDVTLEFVLGDMFAPFRPAESDTEGGEQ